MNIEDIANESSYQARLQVMSLDKDYFYRQKTYYTFADKSIVPSYLNVKMSRSEADTKEEFLDVDGYSRIFPVFGASMSYMRSTFAQDLHTYTGGIHILPRVGLTEDERWNDAHNAEVPVGVSLGVSDSAEFIDEITNITNVKFLSIDVAHGASAHTLEVLNRIRELGIYSGVIAGNVGSPLGFLFLYNSMKSMGFDHPIIKVGVGPGSVCTTRVNTGVGVGQLSLLEDIFELTDRVIPDDNLKYISDGGVNNPGDFVKALSRSNGVMMSKLLICHSVEKSASAGYGEFKVHGMASAEAKGENRFVEGGSQVIKPMYQTMGQIGTALREGLQSAMTYVNSADLEEFRLNVNFAINSAGAYAESGIH